MKTLYLSIIETKELLKDGAVEITRNGNDILVELDYEGDYRITIINPYKKIKLYESK